MANKSMKKIAEVMSDLDICMLTTVAGKGVTSARPMSNNNDVAYDGTSYYFTEMKSKTAKDIKKNPNVSLSFTGSKMLSKIYVSVSGRAKLIQDREEMNKHWNKDLEIYFKKGLDTPGVVMVEVKAKHIKYWHGKEEGERSL